MEILYKIFQIFIIKNQELKKKEINNISIDYLLDKLEDNKNQKKIINYITNYKKIPQKTIDYFKNLKPIDIIQKKKIKSEKSKENNIENNSKITDNEIKQIIIDYLRIKYNELSIFNIDIYIIYIEGWDKNCLNEEGPREYIFHRIKNFNKRESKCTIM